MTSDLIRTIMFLFQYDCLINMNAKFLPVVYELSSKTGHQELKKEMQALLSS